MNFPHTSTLDPNICSNKNNDDDDDEEEEEEEEDDDDNDDDNGQFTQKFTKLSALSFLGSFGCIILAMIGQLYGNFWIPQTNLNYQMFPEITSVKAGDLSLSFCSLESGKGTRANITKAFQFFLKTLRVKVYTKGPVIILVGEGGGGEIGGPSIFVGWNMRALKCQKMTLGRGGGDGLQVSFK